MELNNMPESQAREEAKGPIAKTLLYFGYPVNAQNIENSEHWHKSELPENLSCMPDIIQLHLKRNTRFKLVFDYDPVYPNALILFLDREAVETISDDGSDPRNLLERVSDECLIKALSLLKDTMYFPSTASEIKDLVSAAIAADNAGSAYPPPDISKIKSSFYRAIEKENI